MQDEAAAEGPGGGGDGKSEGGRVGTWQTEKLDLSDALHQSIARDTRRRLRAESASRVMHRGTPASAAQLPDVYPAQTATTTA